MGLALGFVVGLEEPLKRPASATHGSWGAGGNIVGARGRVSLPSATPGRSGCARSIDGAKRWPRAECPDPDKGLVTLSALLPILSSFVDYDTVPVVVVQATCEMARELLGAQLPAA